MAHRARSPYDFGIDRHAHAGGTPPDHVGRPAPRHVASARAQACLVGRWRPRVALRLPTRARPSRPRMAGICASPCSSTVRSGTATSPGCPGHYWDDKIARNVGRDRRSDATLVAGGWTVVRRTRQARRTGHGSVARVALLACRSPVSMLPRCDSMRWSCSAWGWPTSAGGTRHWPSDHRK